MRYARTASVKSTGISNEPTQVTDAMQATEGAATLDSLRTSAGLRLSSSSMEPGTGSGSPVEQSQKFSFGAGPLGFGIFGRAWSNASPCLYASSSIGLRS